jgi:ferredoxin
VIEGRGKTFIIAFIYLPLNSRSINCAGVNQMAATVNEDDCVGCGACAEVCPSEAITVNDIAKVDLDKCTECGTCVDECPNGAITLE